MNLQDGWQVISKNITYNKIEPAGANNYIKYESSRVLRGGGGGKAFVQSPRSIFRSSSRRLASSLLLRVWPMLMLQTRGVSEEVHKTRARSTHLARSILRCWILSMFCSIESWMM